jgi:hypothetical protein
MKAVAGYETYHRNERGVIKKQATVAKNKQSFMMKQVLANAPVEQDNYSTLDRDTYQAMQKINEPPGLRQSLSSRAIPTSSLINTPYQPSLGPIQQYTDRFRSGLTPGLQSDYD